MLHKVRASVFSVETHMMIDSYVGNLEKSQAVTVKVYDRDIVGSDFLGLVIISLDKLIAACTRLPSPSPLLPSPLPFPHTTLTPFAPLILFPLHYPLSHLDLPFLPFHLEFPLFALHWHFIMLSFIFSILTPPFYLLVPRVLSSWLLPSW